MLEVRLPWQKRCSYLGQNVIIPVMQQAKISKLCFTLLDLKMVDWSISSFRFAPKKFLYASVISVSTYILSEDLLPNTEVKPGGSYRFDGTLRSEVPSTHQQHQNHCTMSLPHRLTGKRGQNIHVIKSEPALIALPKNSLHLQQWRNHWWKKITGWERPKGCWFLRLPHLFGVPAFALARTRWNGSIARGWNYRWKNTFVSAGWLWPCQKAKSKKC